MSATQNRTATFRHALVLLLGSCLPVMAAVLIAPVLPQIMQHFAGVPNAELLVPLSRPWPRPDQRRRAIPSSNESRLPS